MKYLVLACAAFGLLLVSSCEKDFDQPSPRQNDHSFTTKTCNGFSVSSFSTWGSAHNNVLDQVNENFEFDTTQIEDLYDAIAQVVDYLVPEIASELSTYTSEPEVEAEIDQMPWMVVNEICFDSLWSDGGE